MPRLDDVAVTGHLAATPGWTRSGQAITRAYRLRDFKEAMMFVNGVAALAERAEHHPDIAIRYNEVALTLWTHSEGGLTERDFTLARRIDAVLGAGSAASPAG